jgi:Zn finger protein HypA/HybF involved in hydrogenase expression
MNLGAIFIGVALLVVAVPYVVNPLVNERKRQPVKAASPNKEGKGEQKEALAAIRDLDFDFQTGKVNQDDYETLRAQLVLAAAAYLQTKQQEEEKIDALIRARLEQVKASVKCEQCGGEIGPQDLFCPACGAPIKNLAIIEKPVLKLACPICGKSIKEKDLFCTRCGTRVNKQPASENLPKVT